MAYSVPTTKRPGRGNSIIAFPNQYVMVDLETTGYSPVCDRMIEIGAIRYRDGREVDRFQSLVQPTGSAPGCYVDEFIEDLTGITNEMLADAPTESEALPPFLDYLGDDIILGYNVSFDVNFLYDARMRWFDEPLTNNFVDVLRLARKVYPDMEHHRLRDMLDVYDLVNQREHRTISDCEATDQVYRKLYDDAMERYGSEGAIIRAFPVRTGRSYLDRMCTVTIDKSKVTPDCPLYRKHCIITGRLDSFFRADAQRLIEDLGGINDKTVNKETNFLILGNNDYCSTIKDGKSAKHKKAEALKLKGQDIEIIPENVFYDIIADFIAESAY